MLIVFLPLILLSWKETFFVLHTHILSILIYFCIVFGHGVNNFPFYNNSQHDSDTCQLAKHFHMCISGASEQACERNPHLHPPEAEGRGEKQKKPNRDLSLVSDVKPCSLMLRLTAVFPNAHLFTAWISFSLSIIGPRQPPLQCLLSTTQKWNCKQKGDLCREALPQVSGGGGIFGLKKLALFYACKQQFEKGKDSKKERKTGFRPLTFWGLTVIMLQLL